MPTNATQLKTLIFTVTNELNYDQRMQRIAGTLSENGYRVILVGRKVKGCPELINENYQQIRLGCLFNRGVGMYFLFNIRLFIFLLFQSADLVCAIDLDTILPVYFTTLLKGQKRVYDAHELFTEQKEIITRPFIYKIWLSIEKFAVPKFSNGYTVNGFIANELNRRYGVTYAVVRNLPVLYPLPNVAVKTISPWIIYQGAVNEGRCFETLIPAMKNVNAPLKIYGKGNFFKKTIQLIQEQNLCDKIKIEGTKLPTDLQKITPNAYIGLTLFEPKGLNQLQSLSNRFFDYIMAGIPQICVNYPEYAALNKEFKVAALIADIDSASISGALNNLLQDTVLYHELTNNCLKARAKWNWQSEKQHLINFYEYL